MAAGKCHTLAVTESQRLFAFGSNSEGQLGLGETEESEAEFFDSPQEVAPFTDSQIVKLAAGSMHSMALTQDGQARWFAFDFGGIFHKDPVVRNGYLHRLDSLARVLAVKHASQIQCAFNSQSSPRLICLAQCGTK